jgi:hypothetical protein
MAESANEADSKLKVFISYSRKDMAFADRLEAALKARGFEPPLVCISSSIGRQEATSAKRPLQMPCGDRASDPPKKATGVKCRPSRFSPVRAGAH